MSAIAFLRELLEAGVELGSAIIAAEKFERKNLDVIEARRAKDRERKRKPPRNSAESEETTESTERQESPFPPSPKEIIKPPSTHTRSVSSRGDAREDAAFARFWLAYPRKVAKPDARKAFAKAWRKLPAFEEEEILCGGLERAKASWADAQFIPHPATWLNGERWSDEPTVIQTGPPNVKHHPDPRQSKFVDRLADIDAAMGAAFQPVRQQG